MILIKMEMPKNCAYCPCEHYECGLMGDEHNGVDVTAYFDGDKRHPDCPLIEVPPHGRLIDADAAMKAACEALCHLGVFCPDNLCKEVRETFDAVPTIIESEE